MSISIFKPNSIVRGVVFVGVFAVLCTAAATRNDRITEVVKSITAEERKVLHEIAHTKFNSPKEEFAVIKEKSESLHAKLLEFAKLVEAALDDMGGSARGYAETHLDVIHGIDREPATHDETSKKILRGAADWERLSAEVRAEVEEKLPSMLIMYGEKEVKAARKEKAARSFELKPFGKMTYERMSESERIAKAGFETEPVKYEADMQEDAHKFINFYINEVNQLRRKLVKGGAYSTEELTKWNNDVLGKFNNLPEESKFFVFYTYEDVGDKMTDGKLLKILTFINNDE